MRRTSVIVCAAGVAALVTTSVTHADPVVPAGFVVDTLVNGQLDETTPRIEAIRNPAYGSGVVAASIANGILTVRRISFGSVEVIGSTAVTDDGLLDVRFDTTGLFGGDLFVATSDSAGDSTRLFRVTSDGTIWAVVAEGSPGNGLAFYIEFSAGANGYDPGAYLPDLNGNDGSSLWFLQPDGVAVPLAQNSVPPGRNDIDIRGLEFDRSPGAAFGGRLLVVEADTNQSTIGGVYVLEADLSWTTLSVNENTPTRHLRDIALSPAGALGAFAYMTEAVDDVIERLEPDGTVTDWASGFDFSAQYDNDPGGAASLTVDDTGDVMYVADDSGIYRIRPTGEDPGPVLICREPNTPGGVHYDTGGLPNARLIWSEAITFTAADITVTDGNADPVPFAVSGSGSQFMLISFGTPLFGDQYTITVADTAVAASNGFPIDGDDDGLAGGDLVITLTHRCPADFNGDGIVNAADLATLLAAWGACP